MCFPRQCGIPWNARPPLFRSLHSENASMSDNPHDCDAILLESIDIVDIPNIKLLKKKRLKV